MRSVRDVQCVERKDFKIVLIAFYGVEFGVYALSSFLEKHGYEPHVILFKHLSFPSAFMYNDYITYNRMHHDVFPAEDRKNLLQLLRDIDPDLIGFSVSSVTFQTAEWIMHAIRDELTVPVIWGGVHAILCPEECIQIADYVCIGEGEFPLLALAENLRFHKKVSTIKNLWIKRANSIEKNSFRPLVADLDSLPISNRYKQARQYFIDRGKVVYKPVVTDGNINFAYPLMASRGCLYSCSFCCNSVIREKYKGLGSYCRRRSVEHVICELKAASRNIVMRQVRFWDDVFTYDKEWILNFCERYRDEIGLPFTCYAHPDNTEDEVLHCLVNAGLTFINIGIQSGSPKTSKELYHRSVAGKSVVEFSCKVNALGVMGLYDIIVDNGEETDSDNIYSSELLMKLRSPYIALMYSLCYFPKTPFTQKLLSEGKIEEKDLEQKTSKAINNFFLSLPLSKSRHDLFWNLIKVMSANRYFGNWFVRWARTNRMFKKFPRLLFGIAWLWMQLVKERGRIKRIVGWPVQILFDGQMDDRYFLYKDIMFANEGEENVFFAQGRKGSNRILGARLRNYRKKDRILGVMLDLIPMAAKNFKHRTRWWIPFREMCKNSYELTFAVYYPNVQCRVNGQELDVFLTKKHDWGINNAGPVAIRLFVVRPSKKVPFRKNYFHVGQLIFCENVTRIV